VAARATGGRRAPHSAPCGDVLLLRARRKSCAKDLLFPEWRVRGVSDRHRADRAEEPAAGLSGRACHWKQRARVELGRGPRACTAWWRSEVVPSTHRGHSWSPVTWACSWITATVRRRTRCWWWAAWWRACGPALASARRRVLAADPPGADPVEWVRERTDRRRGAEPGCSRRRPAGGVGTRPLR
jgi:hypothetical protein